MLGYYKNSILDYRFPVQHDRDYRNADYITNNILKNTYLPVKGNTTLGI